MFRLLTLAWSESHCSQVLALVLQHSCCVDLLASAFGVKAQKQDVMLWFAAGTHLGD